MINQVRRLEQLYKRVSGTVENILMPFILLLWPLIKVTQGVDVSDSTYSLGNYLFADKLSGVWVVSTYVSNLIGSLMVKLPGGDALLGMNIYTGLVVSLIALVCYFTLRRDFTSPVMFAGEFIAINFCWIPTGILYNYLTYLLFTLAAICIYKAIRNKQPYMYVIAGILLGINVFVRIPNLAEMALIVVVWSAAPIEKNKKDFWSNTLYCVIGYVIGVALPLMAIIATYGVEGITSMITGLSDMSSSNGDYTIGAMIIATIKAYGRSAKWLFIILAVIFAGTLMMAAVKKKPVLKWVGRVVYALVIIVMLRFFWGRGMYSFRYYEDYTAMYEWGMMVLFLALITSITVLVKNNYNILVKTYAVITLVMLVITPLGSNNYTYQNINNLFLVMPFIIYVTGGWLYRGVHRLRLEGVLYGCNFPWMSMVITILAVIAIQSSLFHVNFVFKDGMDGTPRDTKITTIDSLKGIRTNSDNASALTGLSEYIENNRVGIDSAIYWGDDCGLSYILRLPAGISTTWPDLDTYSVNRMDEDLIKLSTSSDIDRTAIIWRKIDVPSGNNGEVKQDILQDFIATNHMEVAYENTEYIVYTR